ncbi:MAG: RNA 2'-phosphotransferase [Armatimonadota bacterium]|nr:RNA 2'-phosphotransferase [Armatimonadota bacterium]
MPGSRTTSRSAASERRARLSRLVALVLRHRPEEVGVRLDSGGYADLEALAAGLATQPGWESLSSTDLLALAQADPRRYEVRDGRIRARYGHTIRVEEPGEPALPPEWLYIGVRAADVASLRDDGLRPAGRQHLHLATTPQAALEVGRRHAPDAVVVVVFARRAADSGTVFRRAGPALFLTDYVPPAFLLLPGSG